MKTASSLLRWIPLAVLLLTLSACSKATKVFTKAAGHDITATLEGSHAIDTQADRAVVTGEFGKVTIEASRMRMGDGNWTRIPEGMPVALGISKHKRWVTVGGVSVKETSY